MVETLLYSMKKTFILFTANYCSKGNFRPYTFCFFLTAPAPHLSALSFF